MPVSQQFSALPSPTVSPTLSLNYTVDLSLTLTVRRASSMKPESRARTNPLVEHMSIKSVGTVMILPACTAHNKANSNEKYDVRKEYLEGNFGLVLKCCCYNTKELECHCEKCKLEVHTKCAGAGQQPV